MNPLDDKNIHELVKESNQLTLNENAPSMLPNAEPSFEKKRITFASKIFERLSVRGTKVSTLLIEPSSQSSIDPSLKAEHETLKLQNEIKKKQKQNVHDMKVLNAEIQETEISCKEFLKAINEFEKFVIERGFDPMANRISSKAFISFLKDASRNGTIITESIRMKTQTLKADCRKQKRLLMKREELSSSLRPIDFKLATIEKKKFQVLHDEKLNHCNGLRKVERAAIMSKNHAQRQLLEDSIKLDQITAKANICERSVIQMKQDEMNSQDEIDELKKSVQELVKMNKAFEAPTVIDYIEKINKRDSLKNQLKIAKRKTEVVKMILQNMKKKHSRCKSK